MASPHREEDIGLEYLSNRGGKIQCTSHEKTKNKPQAPDDLIDLSVASNLVADYLITEKLQEITKNLVIEPKMLLYPPDQNGSVALKTAIAKLLTTYTKANGSLDPNNITVLSGCLGTLVALSMVLFDSGDGVLIPGPCYQGVYDGFSRTPEVKVIYTDLDDKGEIPFDPVELTVERLEASFEEAEKEGVKIRALFLINPHNPTGDIYPESVLRQCLEFAKRHSLHVIVDEIYMLSVFGEDAKFTSVLSLEGLPDPQRTHMVWGFSKDFCMSGLPCGVLHSWNKHINNAVKAISFCNTTTNIHQRVLTEMLQDENWLEQTYIPTNHQLLRESHRFLTGELDKLGVPHLKRGAGLFVWVNMQKFLPDVSFEEEFKLFKELVENGVRFTPGKVYFCRSPGWFRIIFAAPIDTLKLAINRLGKVLEKRQR